jgi:transcriptional regulatory protein RtcR
LRFHSDALEKYLKFAQSVEAIWQGNFRDLTESVTRMATLANGERIGLNEVNTEIQRLQRIWNISEQEKGNKPSILTDILTREQIAQIDEFDRIQLQGVIEICQKSKSMADAGRRLFSVSREQRQSTNDSDRVKKYLAKFGLQWDDINISIR